MRKDLRRQTILLAAQQVFAEAGPEGVSMERVASMVGISRAVLYDHFPSRSDLMAAIHDDYGRFVQEKVSAAVAGRDRDLETLARASVQGFLDAVAERGILNRTVIRIAGSDPDMQTSQRRLWQQAVDGTMERVRPLLRPVQDKQLRLAADMTLSLMVHAATLWLSGDCTRDEAEDLYVTMAVPALRAIGDSAPRS
jgi:AcrR family transcriptional regulator